MGRALQRNAVVEACRHRRARYCPVSRPCPYRVPRARQRRRLERAEVAMAGRRPGGRRVPRRPASRQGDQHSDPSVQGADRGRAAAAGERGCTRPHPSASEVEPLGSCPMSDRDALLHAITAKAVVLGKVTLSSGREAEYYVDLRRITLDAAAAPLVGSVMLDLTDDLAFDAVGGRTLGADPVATAMLHTAAARGRKLDAFVVRKEGKAHGLQRRIEGPDVRGRRVLAVEDTSTTGGSVLTAVEALREAGAEVVGVAVIVERGAAGAVADAGLPYRAAYSLTDLGLE